MLILNLYQLQRNSWSDLILESKLSNSAGIVIFGAKINLQSNPKRFETSVSLYFSAKHVIISNNTE